MNTYILGWFLSVVLLIGLGFMIIKTRKMQKKIDYLNEYHAHYVLKQMVDLRKICHNINTPINSMVTVFEIFKMELYGSLPQEYVMYADGANQAINDLMKNVNDIQSYCNYYAEKNKISMKNIATHKHIELDNPYIVNH